MFETKFLYGLHRPFHKPLKAIKWVCEFAFSCQEHEREIALSEFSYQFFIYFISKLNSQYLKLKDKNVVKEGITPFLKTEIILDKLNGLNFQEKVFFIKNCLFERKSEEDRILYSAYKACSYYLTLAKKKLYFVEQNNVLTDIGCQLLACRASFFVLSNREKLIFFEQIVKNDFILFLSLCIALKLKSKYKLQLEDIHLSFVENAYHINYFKYVQKSQARNYDNVRLGWIESLGVVDSKKNIRKKYLNIIENSEVLNHDFRELKQNFLLYVKNNLIEQNRLLEQYVLLENIYQRKINEGKHDLGFVNLYEIKKGFRMSNMKFGQFLNDYYFSMKKRRIILFSNVVSSIDRRPRFLIKNVPVIKIRIIKKDGNK